MFVFASFGHHLSPLHQQQQHISPLLGFLPLLVPFLPAFIFPSAPLISAQCSTGCDCCGGERCGGCQQSQLDGIVFPTALNASSNGTQSVTQNSTSETVKLKEMVPKMVVDTKKNNSIPIPTRRRRRNTTLTDWCSEKLLTPQQLEAKFQQIRLIQQRPLAPLQPELPPLQPPDFPPLSVPTGNAPSSVYGYEEASGKFRPQATSGMGQFIHVKPTVTGEDALEQRTDAIELEDPTLKHPFEEPFLQ